MAWLDVETGQQVDENDPQFAELQAAGRITFDYQTPYRQAQERARTNPNDPRNALPDYWDDPTVQALSQPPTVAQPATTGAPSMKADERQYGMLEPQNRVPGDAPALAPQTRGGITRTEADPQFAELFGPDSGIPQINPITLAENPQLSAVFAPEFDQQWQGFASDRAGELANFYDWGDWPTMEASQLDLGGVPQPTAQTPGSNEALDFLLSGQGFDPQVLAMLKGQATDDLARSAAGQRSSAKLAAQQAGLAGSGAGLAMQGQINRRQGDATARAKQGVDIENAVRGLENRRLGAPLELQRQTSASAMANDMAIQNAARLFAGMQQNVANAQQAAGINTQNTQQRNMERAGTQAGFYGDVSRGYNAALLNKGAEADRTNVSNAINRNLNQAQLDRQADIFNTTTGENRYGQAFGGLLGLTNQANPTAYATSGAQLGVTQPNLFPAQTYQNLGNQAIQAGQNMDDDED